VYQEFHIVLYTRSASSNLQFTSQFLYTMHRSWRMNKVIVTYLMLHTRSS